MKRAVVWEHLRSLCYFCDRNSSTALLSVPGLSAQSSCVRNRLPKSFASDAVSVGNGLIGTNFMSPSLISARFQRSLSTQSGFRTLPEAIEAFTTAAEALEAFKDIESDFGENHPSTGHACFKIARLMEEEKMAPEKILAFATRAVNIFNLENSPSLHLGLAMHLMGAMLYETKRFHEALACLNRADRVFNAGDPTAIGIHDARLVIHAVQHLLAKTNKAMGRMEAALVNMKRCFELKKLLMEPNSLVVADGNYELAEAYAGVLNFKEALPLCLKALEIVTSLLGSNSVQVAHRRKLLSNIYSKLGEHQKSLEQIELAKEVFKNLPDDSYLVHAEIDGARMQIELGRFDEAINTLESVVQRTDSRTRAIIYVEMAKAFWGQEKFEDSKRCLEISCSILDNMENSICGAVAVGYGEIALQYEVMSEVERAISLSKKALSIFEKLPPDEHYAVAGIVSARIGALLLLCGNVSQAVPYLERGAEKLKQSLGSEKHCGLGFAYKYLGAAYLELERHESAAQMSALAKDIFDFAFGPHHPESIESCQNLANAYRAMGSYALAMEFQQRVIDAWKSHGSNAKDKLEGAERLLKELKGQAQDRATTDSILNVCDI